MSYCHNIVMRRLTSISRHARHDAGGVEGPARHLAVGDGVVALEEGNLLRPLLGEPVPFVLLAARERLGLPDTVVVDALCKRLLVRLVAQTLCTVSSRGGRQRDTALT